MEYTLSYILPLLVLSGAMAGGFATNFAALFIFLILPIMEALTHKFLGDAHPRRGEEESRLHDYVLYGYVVLQTIALFAFLYRLAYSYMPVHEQISLTLSAGCMGAVGITAAHELVHRTSKWEQRLGLFLLSQVTYMHFRVEHVFGHHRNVATPLDAATAQKDESLYVFLPRSIFESYMHSFKLDNSLKNTGLKNRPLLYSIILAGIYLAIYLVFGAQALRGFFLQSCVAIILLEAVNYLEHYGLRRRADDKGRYEKQEAKHSWDTYSYFTNALFFNLGYHGDHHMKPLKPYQTLEEVRVGNDLPYGYTLMFYLSLIPSEWKKMMNPRARKLTGDTEPTPEQLADG